jgi:hypothetical protein
MIKSPFVSARIRSKANRLRGAFLLLETMVGVAVFAIGVLALAKCVYNCLNAEVARKQDQLARMALENRMAEIESGAETVEEPKEDKLKGTFEGITLLSSRKPFPYKNEKDQDLPGLFIVDLEAKWKAPDGAQSKSISFYVLQQK